MSHNNFANCNMVKFLCSTSMMLTIFFFVGCHSHTEILKFKYPKAKDYISRILSVYEPEKSLYAILDSIIIKTEECPEYQNRKEKVSFSFGVTKGSFLGPEEEWGNPLVGISVNYYTSRLTDYRWTIGVFYYNGYAFYIDDLLTTPLLKKTKKEVLLECIAPEKYQYDILFRGDRDMYWWYRYKQGNLVNIGYGHCPQ